MLPDLQLPSKGSQGPQNDRRTHRKTILQWPMALSENECAPPNANSAIIICPYISRLSENSAWYNYGKTPQFARADTDDMSEQKKNTVFCGTNAHVHDHGFHLARHSLATCALNVTTTSSSSSSSSSASSPSSSSNHY